MISVILYFFNQMDNSGGKRKRLDQTRDMVQSDQLCDHFVTRLASNQVRCAIAINKCVDVRAALVEHKLTTNHIRAELLEGVRDGLTMSKLGSIFSFLEKRQLYILNGESVPCDEVFGRIPFRGRRLTS